MINNQEILDISKLSFQDDTTNHEIQSSKIICDLWAGCGHVWEIKINHKPDLIIKRISMPNNCTSIGDCRKKQSYICETKFYLHFANHLISINCQVPKPLHIHSANENGSNIITIAMSKLHGTNGTSSLEQSAAFMCWLANLHSEYWGSERANAAVALGLQEQGTYWYLETRPDELAAMPSKGWEGELKQVASRIDTYLKREDCFPTILHGDAKLANMLFTQDEEMNWIPLVYDFQYAGKGSCGKDLAKFLTCGTANIEDEELLLQIYHTHLIQHLKKKWNYNDVDLPSFDRLKVVVDVCIADLGRFMSGWGWWGHDRQAKIEEKVLNRLEEIGI